MADENKYNIKIEAGTDFVLPFLWTDDNDNPYDLTGATVTAQLREHSGDPDAFDFLCQHNNEGGRIWLVMPNEVTKEIPFSYGVYDVRVTLPSGEIKEPLYGDAKIQDEVTKPLDGTMLYMIGVSTYEDLPSVGILNRLYFCYDDRKIYRWNGTNYVSTAVGNGIQRIDYLDGGTYRMVFDDGTYFDFESVPRLMGMHDSTLEYQKLDVAMASNGASYVALIPVPADTEITDTDYWMQITPKTPTIGTVTDVAYDAGAEVTMTGTADAPVLNFKIPRGVTGNESIDDSQGAGDTDYVWSADKTYNEIADINQIVTTSTDEIHIYKGTFAYGLDIRTGTIVSGSAQGIMTYEVPKYTFVKVVGKYPTCNRCCIGLGDHDKLAVGDTLSIVVSTYVVSANFVEYIYTGNYNYLSLYYKNTSSSGSVHDIPAEIVYDNINASKKYLAEIPDGRVVSYKVSSLIIGQVNTTTGVITEGNKKRIFTNKINFAVGSVVRVKNPSGIYCNLIQYDTEDGYHGSYGDWQTSTEAEFTVKHPVNRIMFRTESDSAFTNVNEVAGFVLYEYKAESDYSIARYYGKKISILGDSLSTFGGNIDDSYKDKRYSPEGNIYNYPGNQCRYPQLNLAIYDPHQMYWMQAIDALGMTLGINESWARSRVSWNGVEDTEKIIVDGVEYWASPYGVDRHMASQTRIDNLGDNGTPDIILVNGGTNDAGNNVTIGTVNYESPQGYTPEQIAALPVDTFADAYRTMLIRLMYTYPKAKIICMTPSYRSGNYAVQKLDQYIEVMKEICDMFGIVLIDTRHSGVSILEATSSGYLPDGTHYNASGMRLVGELLIRSLLFKC